MSLKIENKLVADGRRLSNRMITLRSQSVIPTFAFRRTVLPVNEDEDERDMVTWSGLGTVGNLEEHAIDYEPLGHAMALMLGNLAGAMHNSGSFAIPEEMTSLCLIEPYDIKLQGDDRVKLKPEWMPEKGDLFCFMLNNHKEYHECTGVMAQSMLAGQGSKYALAQRFDLDYLDAFNEEDITDVAVPYE